MKFPGFILVILIAFSFLAGPQQLQAAERTFPRIGIGAAPAVFRPAEEIYRDILFDDFWGLRPAVYIDAELRVVASQNAAASLIASSTLYRKDSDVTITTVDQPTGTGDVMTIRYSGEVRHFGVRLARACEKKNRIWIEGGAAWARFKAEEVHSPDYTSMTPSNQESWGWFAGVGMARRILHHMEAFATVDYTPCVRKYTSSSYFNTIRSETDLGGISAAAGIRFNL